MSICKQCGAELNDTARFCSKCGAKLDEAKYCGQCGAEIHDGDLFCEHCGAKLGGKEVRPRPIRSSVRQKCIPDKEYITYNRMINIAALENKEQFKELQRKRNEYRQIQQKSELAGHLFWQDCFVVLEDGTMVGFIQGHTQKYLDAGAEDYHFNLYRLETDRSATFLNAGIRSSIENMYVLNGFAYCSWGTMNMKVQIY